MHPYSRFITALSAGINELYLRLVGIHIVFEQVEAIISPLVLIYLHRNNFLVQMHFQLRNGGDSSVLCAQRIKE